MSENLPLNMPDFQHDFTISDLKKIDYFKESGMLGLHTLDPTHVERAMALYVDGKSYRQISSVLKVDKTIILFLAHKFKWYELRKEYLDELNATMRDKVIESKLQSQEFLLHLSLAFRKKIGRSIDKFLRTDDVKHFEEVDGKDVAAFIKVEEMLHRLNAENFGSNNSDKPLVGLNGLGEGMTITKNSDNSIDITPKVPSPFSSKLKQFADMKREQEKENTAPKSIRDIKSETENPIKPESPKDEKIPD